MKTLMFFSLSLAGALGIPVLHPGEVKNSLEENRSPLLGDWLPVQGHVVVENPAPQAAVSLEEHHEKVDPVETKQSESRVVHEVEVKPEIKEEQELKPEAEVKQEPEVKVEGAGKVEQEVKVDEGVKPQQDMLESEAKTEQKLETDPGLQVEPRFKVDAEVKEEVSMEKEDKAKPEVKEGEDFGTEEEDEPVPDVLVEVEAKLRELELQVEPEFKVESEIKVDPDVQIELEPEEEPLLTEAQVKMSPGQWTDERHIDMERQYEAMGEPYMELEPLDDDKDEEIQETTFQRRNLFVQGLAGEEEKLMSERNHVFNEETSVEMELEMIEEPLPNQDIIPDDTDLEGEAALDMAGQQVSFPEEEPGVEMRDGKQEDSVDEEEHLMMLEEARKVPTEEEISPVQFLEEQEEEEEDKGPQSDVLSQREHNALLRERPDNQEWRHCPGVLLEEKCYQFFKGQRKAADAEFFCQEQFPKGHLASITSRNIHRELINLILKENGGYTRTWVGGIRYLDTNRFVWLDGSQWTYADWLSGEPNYTSGVEDCVEVLAFGKFNDFTCWEPQSFICSYSYQ